MDIIINNDSNDIINANKLLYDNFITSSYENIKNIKLYVKINGVTLLALIDTGSSNTIMSNKSIHKCYLDSLLDSKINNAIYGFNNINKLIGRIWFTQINIRDIDFMASICVVDKLPLNFDIIIGCDFMKYNNFTLNFKNSIVSSDDNFITNF